MSISAMKCALQSLESVEKVKGWNKDSVIGRHCTQSAHFLRQAIAEAEKQEPVVGTKTWFKDGKMVTQHLYASDISQERVDETDKDRHERAMQKMVDENQRLGLYDDEQPTCQQNRQVAKSATTEWVGLTDEERKLIIHEWRHQEGKAAQLCQAIEAKLKEKNCG